MKTHKIKIALVLFVGLAGVPSYAQLSMPRLFSDNMVLQQKDEVALWGNADANENVTITTSWGEEVKATANDQGEWRVSLSTPEASFTAHTVRVSTDDETKLLSEVLVGEVWLCSGQSNMAFRLVVDDNGESEIANASNVPLRLLHVPSTTAAEPQYDLPESTSWVKSSPQAVENFSAVAYFYGKNLMDGLDNTPVGLINASFGSATIEAFMSREALMSKPYLEEHLNNYTSTTASKNPTHCYNAMIKPLKDYTVKGVAWYQGESNCVRASKYGESLEVFIASWREQFGDDNLPFMLVQLPPYAYSTSQQEPGNTYSAADLREAQYLASETIDNVDLVVTIDVGDVDDLHPRNKKPVGERLAKVALNRTYGQDDLAWSGPILKNWKIEGTKFILEFDHIDGGVRDTYEELKWFTMAGADKKFHQGNAFVVGNKIEVSTPFVTQPVALRYAWDNTAATNLWNSDGFAASPFRTDDWNVFSTATGITAWSSMPDIRNQEFDLEVPELRDGAPEAGRRVKHRLAGYEGTDVYHTLYLPTNWEAGKKYPVIVEYAGNGPFYNKYDDRCTGKPDDTCLGYGLGAGEDFIWIGMPFVSADGQQNQLNWWGDIDASVQYTKDAVKMVCDTYGGDASQVFVSGFSRGAIGVNYIGLHDDDIASLWCGSIAVSHYDGVKTNWGYPDCDEASAVARLKRLGDIPQYIIQEGAGPTTTKAYIERVGVEGNYSYMKIPYRNHDLRWTLQDIPERANLRAWVDDIISCKASVAAPGVAEKGESVKVNFNLTGRGPWDLTYAINGSPTEVEGIETSPYSVDVVIDGKTEIEVLAVANASGAGSVGEKVTVHIYDASLSVEIDGFVRQTQKDGYYDGPWFEVKNASSWARKGIMMFDISSLDKPVNGAVVKVHLQKISSTANVPMLDFKMSGLMASNDIGESLTWLNHLDLAWQDASKPTGVSLSDLNKYVALDITDHLNALIAKGESKMALLMESAETALVYYFSSMESENEPSLKFSKSGDNTPSGVEDAKESEKVKITAWDGSLNIQNQDECKVDYKVFDNVGSMIMLGSLDGGEAIIIEHLNPGVYVVNAGEVVEKVIL